MQVACNVLGPLQIVIDGVDVTPVAPKERSLLAMLVVNHGVPVGVDRLTDELWPNLPSERARRALQVRVGAVRKLLHDANAASLLEFVPPGYRLAVGAQDIDEHRFSILVAQARRQSEDGDPAAAAASLRDALGLWRGEPLADVQVCVSLEAEAARLAESRLGAIEDRIDADLACGRHHALVSELDALLAHHPLRERLWAQRILALYRVGRQADALGAYQVLRRHLAEELGLDPGPELARLERDILAQAAALDWTAPRLLRARRRGAAPRPSGSNLPSPPETLPFVGRGAELDELRAWWSEEGVRLALVVGEAGIGKTRLATAFAREVERQGFGVLFGRTVEAGGSAYEPVLGALRQFVVSADDQVIEELDETAAGALSRLLPEMTRRRPEVTSQLPAWGDIDRSWLLGAAADCLAGADQSPVLLVLDDLQWADRPALLLLSHLLEPDKRVRTLATCRTPLAATSHLGDFLAGLRREDRAVRRLALGGLTGSDVVDLVSALVGAEPASARRAFAAELHGRTDGNPFFVRETLRQLEDSGAISAVADGSPARRSLEELGAPEGVRDVVGQRLSALAPATRDALGAGAVIGPEFDLDVLSAVLERQDDPVVEAVEEALAAGLVHEDSTRVDRYRFNHALVHEVVLARLGRSRRARLEWRTGKVLEALRPAELDERAGELARHFVAGAAVGDASEAVHVCLRAGARAMERLAYEEAMSYYEMALGALGLSPGASDPERADVLVALGRAANRAGDAERWRAASLEAAALARRAGDPERLARAALSLLGSLGPWPDDAVVALMEEAAEGLRAATSPQRRALLAELLARLSGYQVNSRGEQSVALAQEALAIARAAGDNRALALALLNSTHTYALDRDEHQARVREAAALAEKGGDLEVVLAANTSAMVGALLWADRAAFDRGLAEYARVAAAARATMPLVHSAIDHAGAAALDGRYAEARAQFDEVLRRSEALGDPFLRASIRAGTFPVDRELGRLAERLEELRNLASGIMGATHHRANLVRVLCEIGEHEEATERLEALLAQPEVLLAGFVRASNLARLAEAAELLRHIDGATQLNRWLENERNHGECVIAGPNAYSGAVRRYLGLLALTLGHADDAVDHHEAALEVHERMRARGWVARSRYDLARALLARAARGDDERGVRLLDEAVGEARQLGMPRLLQEAESMRAGGGPAQE